MTRRQATPFPEYRERRLRELRRLELLEDVTVAFAIGLLLVVVAVIASAT